MAIYLRKFQTQSDCDSYTQSEQYVQPFIGLVTENSGRVMYNVASGSPVPPTPPTPVYSAMPFTVEIVSGSGSFTIYPQGNYDDDLYYSINGGSWVEAELLDNIEVSSGDIVQFKGNNQGSSTESQAAGILKENASNDLRYVFYGNIMSLIQETGFESMVSFPDNNTIFNMYFSGGYRDLCPGLTSAEHLILPVTTLNYMCYTNMFAGCTNLTTAPELPATSLASKCYESMFAGCTSLTEAPELPATTLADSCYGYMFDGCTSLTAAPELPATTLAEGCYYDMFAGCTSLNYIKCLATDISADGCTDYWVSYVAQSGTFVKNPNMSNWTTGYDGIPSNWTVEDAS